MPTYLTGSDGCCSYRFRLAPGHYIMGRKADCDFVLFDQTVSRVHAEIEMGEDGRISIKDLGSHNGTFVDDKIISNEADIAAGGKLRLGSATFTLVEEALPARPSKPLVEPGSEQEFAAGVQKNLINFALPPPEGYDIANYLEQCVAIGGDFFDVMPLRDGGSVLIVADVSGHGMGAALLMSHLLASFRTKCMGEQFDLLRCVQLMSELLHNYSDSSQFATLFMAQTETGSGRIKYINAGHCAPIVARARGTTDRLEATGTVVGIPAEVKWEVRETTLEPGDTILIFTDGLPEAACNGEQYGDDRLLRVMGVHRSLPLKPLVDEILDDMDRFICGKPRTDDLAILALRKL